MSRVIKFRGVNAVSGEMVFGQLIKTSEAYKTGRHGFTDCHIISGDVGTQFFSSECRRGMDATGVVVIPETVGQFTGLADKNGADIYEGDIVSCDCGSLGCKKAVSWSQDACRFNVSVKSDYEVIGNVHQNPELILECK